MVLFHAHCDAQKLMVTPIIGLRLQANRLLINGRKAHCTPIAQVGDQLEGHWASFWFHVQTCLYLKKIRTRQRHGFRPFLKLISHFTRKCILNKLPAPTNAMCNSGPLWALMTWFLANHWAKATIDDSSASSSLKNSPVRHLVNINNMLDPMAQMSDLVVG